MTRDEAVIQSVVTQHLTVREAAKLHGLAGSTVHRILQLHGYSPHHQIVWKKSGR